MVRWRLCVVVLLVPLAVGCGDDDGDDDARATSPTTTSVAASTATSLRPAQIAPDELRGRWVTMTGNERVTLSITDGRYEIFVQRGLGGRPANLEFEGDMIHFLTSFDDCEARSTYRWQVQGDTLSLTPIGDEPCENRRYRLAGRSFTREAAASTSSTPTTSTP